MQQLGNTNVKFRVDKRKYKDFGLCVVLKLSKIRCFQRFVVYCVDLGRLLKEYLRQAYSFAAILPHRFFSQGLIGITKARPCP